ncbi:MAG: hypothetical protein AAGM67_10060, partial [Bacteroidota bacterium]
MPNHAYSFAASILFLCLLTFGFGLIAFFMNDCNWIYPIDDTYIHLALTRQLVEAGNWSISLNDFDSASSSPIYPLILAVGYWIWGDWQIYPFLLNLLFGGLSLRFLYRRWEEAGLSPRQS